MTDTPTSGIDRCNFVGCSDDATWDAYRFEKLTGT